MTTKPSRLAREIAEMAGAQRRLGIMDEATYENIRACKSEPMAAIHEMMEGFHQSGAIDKQTMREFDDACLHPAPGRPYGPR
jgi:hypothetical protein